MPIIDHAQQAGVYRIAERFAEAALSGDASLGTRATVWTAAAVTELTRRLAHAFCSRTATFGERWTEVLDGADATVRQLAAEAMCVHLLFPSDIAPATKLRLVETTDPAFVVWPELRSALGIGVAGTGVAFKAARLSQLDFLVRAVAAWKLLDALNRHALVESPSACKAWLAQIPVDGGRSQREALLHLLFPETFEPIVSVDVKRRIVTTFAEHVPADVDDLDDALRHVRAALEPVHGRGFWFIDADVATHWK